MKIAIADANTLSAAAERIRAVWVADWEILRLLFFAAELPN